MYRQKFSLVITNKYKNSLSEPEIPLLKLCALASDWVSRERKQKMKFACDIFSLIQYSITFFFFFLQLMYTLNMQAHYGKVSFIDEV